MDKEIRNRKIKKLKILKEHLAEYEKMEETAIVETLKTTIKKLISELKAK